MDHGKGVAKDVQLSPEQLGDGNPLRRGRDRVPDVDIDVGGLACGGQGRREGDPHAAVGVVLADDLGSRAGGIEAQTVVLGVSEVGLGDREDQAAFLLEVVGLV